MLADIYTASKVKQQIARQCIIPFFNFFRKEDPQFGTPVGALILHWISGIVWIIATPNTPGGYGFAIGIFTYGQVLVGCCMGFAFFFIRSTYEGRESRKTGQNNGSRTWDPVILKSNWFGWPVSFIFIGMNTMALVEGARGSGSPHLWIWPLVFVGLLGGASTYWAAIRWIARISSKRSPLQIRILKNVQGGGNNGTPQDQSALKKARLEGNNRIVAYEVSQYSPKIGYNN